MAILQKQVKFMGPAHSELRQYADKLGNKRAGKPMDLTVYLIEAARFFEANRDKVKPS